MNNMKRCLQVPFLSMTELNANEKVVGAIILTICLALLLRKL